ncbi:MAG: helix-turn-helix domain-containing protein [Candidatus Marinimicrobia bacterium]|nr:helix-turn-helix domain-containing protein [Candidatus Neomarinimicrobiota bacterium]
MNEINNELKSKEIVSRDRVIFSIEEAEEYLGIKKRTLYKLAKTGNIPAIKIGGQWRFSKYRLDALFQNDGKNGDDHGE